MDNLLFYIVGYLSGKDTQRPWRATHGQSVALNASIIALVAVIAWCLIGLHALRPS